jgi:PTS system fructose-specific IIA component/PTS system nitrogen regulatory IIA component
MRLQELIDRPELIAIVDVGDKVAAISLLVERLVTAGRLARDDAEDAMRALLKREALGSTGIGRRVAIPHARVSYVSSPVAALGIVRNGLDFAAVDAELVSVLFLLLSPEGSDREHLEMLGFIGKLAKQATVIDALASATSAAECLRIIRKADQAP